MDSDREEKLKAAKAKLAKFQKKKNRKQNEISPAPAAIDPASVAIEQPQTIDDAYTEFPPDEGQVVENTDYSNSVQPEYVGQTEYTANEVYYYNLYLEASNNYNNVSENLKSVSHDLQVALEKIDDLTILNNQHVYRIKVLEEDGELLNKQLKSMQEIQKKSSESSPLRNELNQLSDWCNQEQERLRILNIEQENRLALIESRQQELLIREDKLKSDQNQFYLEKERVQPVEKQAMQTSPHQPYLDEFIDYHNNDTSNEETQKWVEYYQKKCEELEAANLDLGEQLAHFHNQPPIPVPSDNLELILRELNGIKLQLKENYDEKVAKIDDTNKQILRLLESSNVTASTEFCRAVVELSKYGVFV